MREPKTINELAGRLHRDRSSITKYVGLQERMGLIKVIEARYLGDFQVALNFSDGREGYSMAALWNLSRKRWGLDV